MQVRGESNMFYIDVTEEPLKQRYYNHKTYEKLIRQEGWWSNG